MGLILPLRDTQSGGRGETSSCSGMQESTGVQSRQWYGEVFHWEKTFYSFVLHHHLLRHPMVKFALQKYLNMGLKIKESFCLAEISDGVTQDVLARRMSDSYNYNNDYYTIFIFLCDFRSQLVFHVAKWLVTGKAVLEGILKMAFSLS